MFAINGTEIAVLGVWALGLCAAVSAWSMMSSNRHRLALLIVAGAVPVLGSLVAVATAIFLRARRRHQGPAVGA
jgi:hypothetical protein